MKKILVTLILTISTLIISGQDKIADELKSLIDKKQYDKIIEKNSSASQNYSAKSLYYIALAYYMKADDNNCLKFINLSLTKDSLDANAHYIKASTFNFMKKYDEAIKSFETAISIDPNDAESYSGIGDAYYDLGKKELAIEAYQKSIVKANAPDRAYARIGQIYAELKEDKKSLEAYYIAKSKISKTSDSYINTLYNIGKFEAENTNYDKAEIAYNELIQLSPKDYEAYEKLIQLYYGKKEHEKAKPIIRKLYKAYEAGELKDNLKDRFCFDQFKWKEGNVLVYERFENTPSDNIFYKHLFYIRLDGKTLFKIHTEYSPISEEQGGPKYLLGMTKDGVHSTFPIGFNENLKYEDLKKSVLDIIEEKVKPTTSSKPTK